MGCFMARTTIAMSYVRAALEGAKSRGIDTSYMVRSVGIPDIVAEDPFGRVSSEQYCDLVRSIWLLLEDEFMGFAQRSARPGTFAMMGYGIIHCQNLNKAFKRAAQFYGVITDEVKFRVVSSETTSRFEVLYKSARHSKFLAEALLVLFHRFGSWLIGDQIRLISVDLPGNDSFYEHEVREAFNCPVNWGCSHPSLVFDSRWLDQPIVQTEENLEAFLKDSPAALLARPEFDYSWTGKLRNCAQNYHSQEFPSFEELSAKVFLTPQTLRRRLREEGTSWQEIKDHLRRDEAIMRLVERQEPIQRVAEMMGFSEPSTFHRAFKKWTGLSPGVFRENRLQNRGQKLSEND